MRLYRLQFLALFSLFSISCGGGGESSNPIVNTSINTSPVAISGSATPSNPSTGSPAPLPNEVAVRSVKAFEALSFSMPTVVTHSKDGSNRLFVAELGGTIRVFNNNSGVQSSSLFLDLSRQVVTGGETGLLGFVFDPDFRTNGFFYVCYTAPTVTPGQDHRSVTSRFQVSGDPLLANPASETVLLTFDQPTPFHDGGCLAFGNDGMLYISSGDGGVQGDPNGNSQNLQSLLGKILRISPEGTVPSDNPFFGQGGGVRDEVWAYGLRNPWRMSFDKLTGDLWVGDVGQERVEEINLVSRGQNYGWPLFEGLLTFDNPGNIPQVSTVTPIFHYPREQGKSVTGGYVYRGSANPTLTNSYIYGDFVSGRVWALTLSGQQITGHREIASVPNPIAFGEAQSGELLICSAGGSLYRLEEVR